MSFTNFYKLKSRLAFIENTLLTPRHTFSLAAGSDPQSVLLLQFFEAQVVLTALRSVAPGNGKWKDRVLREVVVEVSHFSSQGSL